MSYFASLIGYLSTIIQFKDIAVKEALLASSDINPDGTRDITYAEAKNSSITGAMLKAALNPNESSAPNTDITSFDELQYFENVASLPTGFLSGCSNLKSIKFPYEILGVGDKYDLLKNTAIEEIDTNSTTLIGASGNSGALFGSKSLFGPLSALKIVWIDKVTSVVGRAFKKEDQPNVEKVIISSVNQWLNIVVNITVSQKLDCMPTASGKASLYIGGPDGQKVTEIHTTGVTALRDHLFDGIQGIDRIDIEENSTTVGIDCFKNINNGGQFILNGYHKITSIQDGAFINCNAGNALDDIPQNAVSMQSCFAGSSLQKATSDVLKQVGATCFRTSSITAVDLPALGTEITPGTTPTIGQIIPGYGPTLSQGVFQSCRSLITANLINLPQSTRFMFYGCTSLTQVKLNSATTLELSCFQGCTALQLLNAPNVKVIKENAFSGCSNLEFTSTSSYSPPDLTETVEEIGTSAFYNTSVKTPIHFKKLTTIQDRAFLGCTANADYVVLHKSDSIVTFVVTGNNQQLKYHVELFGNYNSNPVKKIYVPSNLISAYEADSEWAQLVAKGFQFLDMANAPS